MNRIEAYWSCVVLDINWNMDFEIYCLQIAKVLIVHVYENFFVPRLPWEYSFAEFEVSINSRGNSKNDMVNNDWY